VIVRLLVCGPPVLLTSKNLVLPVRLVPCRPPVHLSSSVKNSVNNGLSRVEHQILDLVLYRLTTFLLPEAGRLGSPATHAPAA
jgi:hypothetical protein